MATPSTSPLNRPTLVDLPLELLDTIVDLAWSELPKPRCLAPCHRLQPCFDRRRLATINLRGASGSFLYCALELRPAIGQHCKELRIICLMPVDARCTEFFWSVLLSSMPALERLQCAGQRAYYMYSAIMDINNARNPDFLPQLRHLYLPFNPWTVPDPLRYERIPLLDHYPNLESLSFGYEESWWGSSSTSAAGAAAESTVQPTPSTAIFGRLRELRIYMSGQDQILKGLLRQTTHLIRLDISSIPSPRALSELLDVLPRPDNLETLELSFSRKSVPVHATNLGEGFVDDGDDGIRVSLAPFIRRLPGLRSLSFSDHCTCFDADSITALKSIAPLRCLKLKWGFEMYFEPEVILAFLKTLGNHAPREVCCDHIEGGYTGQSIRDVLPIDPNDAFPDSCDVHADWSTPEWSSDEIYKDDIRQLIDYGKAAGIEVTGSMVDGLDVTAKWDRELAEYELLQEEHEAAREDARSDVEETEEESDQD